MTSTTHWPPHPASGLEVPAAPRGDSRPVNIVYIIDQLCESGGAERVLLKMIRLLPRHLFRPQLITFRIDLNLDIVQDICCPLHVFPLRRTYDAAALRTAVRLARLLHSERIDVVHTFFETSDLWAGPIARLARVPVLVSSRRDMGILRSRKHTLAYRALGRIFDQTQAVSEVVRRRFVQSDGLAPAKVVTIHNGADLGRIDAATAREGVRVRRDLGLDPTALLVTSVGHIRPVKGFDVLLHSAAIVCRQFPKAVFAIAGEAHDAAHSRDLVASAAQLGIEENVRFLGPVANPLPLLKASDVFCLPSRSEGLSNALLEAMACSLPAVATRVGGNEELIEDGRTGYLVQSEDVYALGGRIADLLAHAERRRDFGRAARRTVERQFTEECMMNRLIREYQNLLAAKRPHRNA